MECRDFSSLWGSPSMSGSQMESKVSNKKRASSKPVENRAIAAKKKKSSEKERIRNTQIKEKLSEIRKSVPYLDDELSKIRTLRLASAYIQHLQKILNGETVYCECTKTHRALSINDFESVVRREMLITNSYKQRATDELRTQSASPFDGYHYDSR